LQPKNQNLAYKELHMRHEFYEEKRVIKGKIKRNTGGNRKSIEKNLRT